MLSEILEMPVKANHFLENSSSYTLPTGVPYIGMGSSYFAPLAFKYMGIDIYPEIASEYYNYLYKGGKVPVGVLLSQSGKSSEVLWCSELFEEYIAISNYVDSPLCNRASVSNIIPLLAGEEKYSSSKTYINTLLALFKGFGIDAKKAVNLLAEKMDAYQEQGRILADAAFELIHQNKINGFYITGSGPNIGTAMEAALIMSESTKLNFNGLPLAQYDHGTKETAKDSFVVNIIAKGNSYDRSIKLGETIKAAGGYVFTVEEPEVNEHESIINNMLPFNFMSYYLSKELGVQDTFVVGGKVTEVT
jgi:glucosamine--fructose-6-phosphate aminotransferase (isomerizing)